MEKAIRVLTERAKMYKEIGTESAKEYAESCEKLAKLGEWVQTHNPDYQPEKVELYEGDEIINQLF